MELVFSKRFRKQAQKLVENRKNLKPKINKCLIDFAANGRQSVFYRKKLTGQWLGYEELQIGGDLRIIFRWNEDWGLCVLEQIGTHAQFGW